MFQEFAMKISWNFTNRIVFLAIILEPETLESPSIPPKSRIIA